MSENIKARFKELTDSEISTSATCQPAGGHPSRSFVEICMYGDEIGIAGYTPRFQKDEQGVVVRELVCAIEDTSYRNEYDEEVVLVLPEPISLGGDDESLDIDPSLFGELLMAHPEWTRIVRLCLGAFLTEYYNSEY